MVGNVLIFACAVGATLSVLVYRLVPWRGTEWGRHLMAYMVSIAAVLDLSCLRILFGDSAWFQLVRLAVFASMPFVIWWRLWLLVKAQMEDRQPGR